MEVGSAASAPKKNKGAVCCVVGCSHTQGNSPGIAYYRFSTNPNKFKQRQKWIKAVKRVNSDGSPWVPNKRSRICSRHFAGNSKSEHPLSPSFVPTIFPAQYLQNKKESAVSCALKSPAISSKNKPALPTEFVSSGVNLWKETSGDIDPKPIERDSVDVKIECELSEPVISTTDLLSNMKTEKKRENRQTQEEPTHFRCRTCLMTDKNRLSASLKQICLNGISVMEAVLQIVPELKIPLNENDFICDTCLDTVTDYLRFRARCLEIDETLKNESETKYEDTHLDGVENDQDADNFENTEEPNNSENEDEHGIHFNNEVDIYEENKCVKDLAIASNSENEDEYGIHFNNEIDIYEEEKCFEDLAIACTRKTRSKKIMKSKFGPADVGPHEKVISFRVHQQMAGDFLKGIEDKVDILYHSTAHQDGNKKLLLLGLAIKKVCPTCGEEYATEDSFQEHFEYAHRDLSQGYLLKPLKKHPSATSRQCDVCGARFNMFQKKRLHMKKCILFQCPYCAEMVPGIAFTTHMSVKHDDPLPFKCAKCKMAFSDFNKRLSHVCGGIECDRCHRKFINLSNHKCVAGLQTRKCQYCKILVPRNLFSQHSREVHRKYVCMCGRGFSEIGALQEHKVTHYQKVLCPDCGMMMTRSSLRNHRKIHEHENPTFRCELCDKLHYTEKALRTHLQKTHWDEKVVCEVCGKSFSSNNIKAHFRLKHDAKPQVYSCSSCPKSFSRKDYYVRHTKHHNFSQEIKERKTRRPRDTSKRRYRYLKDDSFTCKFCLRSCKNIYLLRSHMQTHTKLNRFMCRYCSNTYSSYGSRYRHEKLHKDDPKYKFRCNVCWKIMPDEIALAAHEATHTSQKYSCEYCDETFARKYLYNSHILSHVPEEEVLKEQTVLDEALEDYLA